jgi:hypothetical protein
MNFGFLAFIASCLVLGQSVVASPTKGTTIEVATVHDLSALKAAIPGHATLSKTCVVLCQFPFSSYTNRPQNFNASSPLIRPPSGPALPRDLDIPDLGGPYLVLCSTENCEGICYSYDLSTLVGGCYLAMLPYQSAIVSSEESGYAVDPRVYASLDGCGLPARIPMRNVCYNVYYDGAPYNFPNFNLS